MVDIATWRCRIGSWAGRTRFLATTGDVDKDQLCSLLLNLLGAAVLGVLLLVGGVELNPGPNPTQGRGNKRKGSEKGKGPPPKARKLDDSPTQAPLGDESTPDTSLLRVQPPLGDESTPGTSRAGPSRRRSSPSTSTGSTPKQKLGASRKGNEPESKAIELKLSEWTKSRGQTDGSGMVYEHKMLTLIFLRLIAAGYEFRVACSVRTAGLFDDIVIYYRENSDEAWKSIFAQLKHKQTKGKKITKGPFVNLYNVLSLVNFCASYETMKSSNQLLSLDHKIVIFTNASVDDSLVCEVESDPLVDTGGKAVSFKPGGKVFQGLCEWAEFKEALTELHGRVEGKSDEEVSKEVKKDFNNKKFKNRTINSFKGELLKTPTLVKLAALLAKLKSVKDKNTYIEFLYKLQVYMNQAHESQLDAKIKEQLGKVWKCSVDLEASAMLHALQDKVKSWWQKDNFYLTQDSQLWLDITKSQAETLSKTTTERLTKFVVEFDESSLEIFEDDIFVAGGILNLRVDSRTEASSLRVHQALAKFRPNEIVLHVNVKALLKREDDVLSAWTSRWCRLLVVECDTELDQSQAARIGEKISKIIDKRNEKKVFILISQNTHSLNKELKGKISNLSFDDKINWNDLTRSTRETILESKVKVQGKDISLSGFRDSLVAQFDLEILSELLTGDVNCGKLLDNVGGVFVSRHLLYGGGFPFYSLSEVRRKVVLLVAEPGMGKSTLMTHFANSAKAEDPSKWIVHIKLNDYTVYLKSMDKEELDAEAAWKFLEHCALSRGNKLEALLFRPFEQKLIVFVDAVDEVNPHYEKQIFTLLRCLKDFKFTRLWVSSRPNFESKLEEVLGVDAFEIAKFSLAEQTEFFNKTWKNRDDSISDEQCTEKTNDLLELFKSLEKNASILGVPLVTSMVAEVYNGSIDKIVVNGRLDLISLMEMYVEQKFKILYTEKKKMKLESLTLPSNMDDEEEKRKAIISNHSLAALRVIFSLEEIGKLEFEGKECFAKSLTSNLEKVSDGREKTGIIDRVDQEVPHFTHRLFADYFAACWLASNFKTNQDFTKKIIFHPAYKTLAEMLNLILAAKHQLHKAVLHRDVEEMKRLLETQSDVNELDDGGRTALHLAVLLSGTDLTIVKVLFEEYKAGVDIADWIARWTPLRYAEQARAWQALEYILNNGGENNEEWPEPDPAVMLDAARDASVRVVLYLVEERRGKLDCRGSDGETMIHRAAEGGNIEMIKYLVTKGLSPLSLHTKDNEDNTALHYATHSDNVSAVNFLLDRGLDIEARNSRGLTAFQEAAQHGAYEVMEVLLESNASFEVDSSVEDSLVQLTASLLCAAFSGRLESVVKLVEMGRRIFLFHRYQDKKGHTAAWVAMYRGHNEVLDWLLFRESNPGDTPLHGACRLGDLEIVTYILSRGDDIEAEGWRGYTPLHTALEYQHWAVAEELFKNGANLEARDEYGGTALHWATSWRGREEAVKWLLRHGAKVNTTNNRGDTSLHWAIRFEELNIVKLLLDYNHQTGDEGNAGVTPFVAVAIKGDRDTVKELIEGQEVKADFINTKDTAGWTVFHFLAGLGEADLISYLVSQGGDSTICNNEDESPLYLAVLNKHPDTVRVLLDTYSNDDEKAAAINKRDELGRSVLMCGAREGCEDCVRQLLKAGGKSTQVDDDGRTSLMRAASNGYDSVVSVLLNEFDPVREDPVKTVKELIDMKNDDGETALDLAENDRECRKVMEDFLAKC